MRIGFITVLLPATIGTVSLYAADKTRVDVYISGRDDSPILLGPAKPMPSAIFEKIGVRLNWHDGELRPAGGAGRGAAVLLAFGIRTVEHAPESATSGALASAQILGPSGTEIIIYKDRVLRFLADHPTLSGVAAGYVLAHGLTHAMQGAGRHSESGILKARWSSGDCKGQSERCLCGLEHVCELRRSIGQSDISADTSRIGGPKRRRRERSYRSSQVGLVRAFPEWILASRFNYSDLLGQVHRKTEAQRLKNSRAADFFTE